MTFAQTEQRRYTLTLELTTRCLMSNAAYARRCIRAGNYLTAWEALATIQNIAIYSVFETISYMAVWEYNRLAEQIAHLQGGIYHHPQARIHSNGHTQHGVVVQFPIEKVRR